MDPQHNYSQIGSLPNLGADFIDEASAQILRSTGIACKKEINSIKSTEDFNFTQQAIAILARGYTVPFPTIAKQFKKLNTLSPFVTLSRLTELLDVLEARYLPATIADHSDEHCSVLLHASYVLYCVLFPAADENEKPLFVSHMVNTVERLNFIVHDRDDERNNLRLSRRWRQNQIARLFMIKVVLLQQQQNDKDELSRSSDHGNLEKWKAKIDSLFPKSFHLHTTVPYGMMAIVDGTTFELRLDDWIQQIKGTGLYNHKAAVSFIMSTKGERLPNHVKAVIDGKRPEDLASYLKYESGRLQNQSPSTQHEHQIDEMKEIVDFIKREPDAAVDVILRLQPDISGLDLLTRILTTPETRDLLDLYGFQPWDLARQHLQTSLRYLENADSDEGININVETSAELLTLYLKNILSHGIIDVSIVYMDIQELCTRYIWIPAVLEFRKWFHAAIAGPSGVVESDEGSSSEEQGGTVLGG